MNNPLVSIVVCTYNRAHLLPQTMESVFAQRYKPVEIVVVDDGSMDNTRELVASYGNKIRYYWQENQGIALTRTIACRLAQGEFIAFQDDDDLMPPDRIVILYEALHRHPSAVIAVGDWAIIDDGGNLTGSRYLPKGSLAKDEPILIPDGYEAVLWPRVPAVPHTTLFRRADGQRIGWFDSQYRYASEDKDFFARLGRLGPIVYVPKVVSYHRRGHVSLTSDRILAAYNKLFSLQNYLNSNEPHRRQLKKRLQFRIFSQLWKIASYKSKGHKLPVEIPDDYLNKALSLLPLRDRLKYWWTALIKFPIRTLVRGRER